MAKVTVNTGKTELTKIVSDLSMTEEHSLAKAIVLAIAGYDAAYEGKYSSGLYSVEEQVLKALEARRDARRVREGKEPIEGKTEQAGGETEIGHGTGLRRSGT